MKKIIQLILNYIYNVDIKPLKILFNLCVHFLFFIQHNKITLDNSSIYQLYENYIDKYKHINIIILEKDIIDAIILSFNSLNLVTVNEEFKNNSFIEQVYDCLKNEKQYKSVIKLLEPFIINVRMVKNTQKFMCLSDINSVMLLFSGISELYLPLLNIKYNELYIYDKNKDINLLFELNNKISYNIDIEKNIFTSDVIHDNTINKKVDLIICNIPQDFKNIIYTNCNNTIKNLKIRGTKAEPLLLQLICQLVNKNGKIILYTPTSLLFGESNQHVETRKYLVENFNIEKIIEVENKKSLIIIKNNKEQFNIEVIKNNVTFMVNKENINKENYLLDFYETNKEINSSYDKKTLNELILIKTKNDLFENKITEKILYNYKFNDFNIDLLDNIKDHNYLFFTKDENIIKQEFLNFCLYNFFCKNIEKITKGKMNNISIDLIYNLEFVILPLTTQELILSQIKLNNVIIDNNNTQIQNFIDILNKFIDNMIHNNKKQKLNTIFNFHNDVTNDCEMAIKKNSLTVGTINKIDDINNYKDNTNCFYLSLINKTFNINYFYYLIKYYKNDFINSAFKNKSVGLSKSFLESLEIPILLNNEQEHLVSICEYFYKQIELLENNNNLLKETNILTFII